MQRTKIYRLLPKYQPKEGRAFKRDVKIPAIDTVFIPQKAGGYTEEVIAYERSRPLYVKKWSKDIDAVMENPPTKIVWSKSNDFYVDPLKHKALMEYMDMCNFNASNQNRDASVKAIFEEIDLNKQAQQNLVDDKDETLAKAAAYDGDIEKLREVMVLLGFSRKNIHGELLTEPEVRDQARVAAERNPIGFRELWDDSSVSYRININKALALNIIYIDQAVAEVKWSDNDKAIKTGRIPIGVDILDHLVGFVNQGGQGKTFYDELITRLLGGKKTTDEISGKFKGAVSDAVDSMTPKQLYDKAKELGLIVRKTPYFVIDGLQGNDGRIGRSEDSVIEAIKANTEIAGVEITKLLQTKIKVATI